MDLGILTFNLNSGIFQVRDENILSLFRDRYTLSLSNIFVMPIICHI